MKTIVAPPTVKPLAAILDEYVQLKEADTQRKQLMQANPVVFDLLAVIDRHAGKPAEQPARAGQPAGVPIMEVQAPAAASPDLPASDACNGADSLGIELCCQDADEGMSGLHQTEALPAQDTPTLPSAHFPLSGASAQSSSQHRKGAPRRRADQLGQALSPISRLAFSSHGMLISWLLSFFRNISWSLVIENNQ